MTMRYRLDNHKGQSYFKGRDTSVIAVTVLGKCQVPPHLETGAPELNPLALHCVLRGLDSTL